MEDVSGRPETEVDQEALVSEIVQKAVESGEDLDATLKAVGIDPSAMPAAEKEELGSIVERIKEATAKDQALDGLAEVMVDDPENLQAIEDTIDKLKINTDELMSAPSKAEKKILKESGIDVNDDDAMEEASYSAFMGQDLDNAAQQVERAVNAQAGSEGGTFNPFGVEGDKESYLDDTEALPLDERRRVEGFWNEDKWEDLGPDEEFNQDDLPASGHLELDQHREIREYSRLIVWELPLLSSKSTVGTNFWT